MSAAFCSCGNPLQMIFEASHREVIHCYRKALGLGQCSLAKGDAGAKGCFERKAARVLRWSSTKASNSLLTEERTERGIPR